VARFPLRAKLALVALVLLVLPWAGWLYVREMERFLLSAQEQALAATARAVATALHDRPQLLGYRPPDESELRRQAERELQRLTGAPRGDEACEHIVVDEGQIAGEHQPRGLRVRGLRRGDSGDGTDAIERIDDLRKTRTHGLGALIRAHGHEDLLAMTREERMTPRELRPSMDLQRRLVAPHARARASGQHETVEGCEIGCVAHVGGALGTRSGRGG